MSRNITLSELNEALKPLIEAINKSREEQLSNSTQISETHRMLTAISLKLDAVDQSVTTVTAASTRTTGKKLVGRKGAGEKKPAKRGAKKVAEPTEDDAEAEEAEPAEDAEAEEAEPAEDAEAEEEDSTAKPGKAVKKAAPKKTVAKPAKPAAKAAKPAKKAVAPKKKQFNKMNFFKKEFEADESQFSKVLTKKIRDKVEAEKENAEKLKDLEGDALKKARANIYYHYLKDNNADVLEGLRAKFDAENAAETGDADDAEEAADE